MQWALRFKQRVFLVLGLECSESDLWQALRDAGIVHRPAAAAATVIRGVLYGNFERIAQSLEYQSIHLQ